MDCMWMWPTLLEALNDVLIRWACFLVGIPVQRSLHIRTHVQSQPHLIYLGSLSVRGLDHGNRLCMYRLCNVCSVFFLGAAARGRNFAEGPCDQIDINDMRTIGDKTSQACITDLDPVNQAVEPLGLGNLQRVNPLEVGQGHQSPPQEWGGHCLGIAVAAAQEVAAAPAAARSLDEVIQHLITRIDGVLLAKSKRHTGHSNAMA